MENDGEMVAKMQMRPDEIMRKTTDDCGKSLAIDSQLNLAQECSHIAQIYSAFKPKVVFSRNGNILILFDLLLFSEIRKKY